MVAAGSLLPLLCALFLVWGEVPAAAWLPYVYAVAGHCQHYRRQTGKQHDMAGSGEARLH